MKILVYSSLSLDQQEILEEGLRKKCELFFASTLSHEVCVQHLSSADILVGNPPIEFFENPHSQLKFWQIDSAGFNQYQSLHLTIQVANMGTFFAERCAETIVAGILAHYRGIPELIRLQDKKTWNGNEIRKHIQGLADKKVLILGAGAIALAVKRMLSAFNCETILAARKSPIADLHQFEDVLATLPTIDLVVNTLPGTAINYVSAAFISKMKLNAVYANVGRGNTTDEKALINALQLGKLAGAVLDVTETEPLPATNELWEMHQVILTQHSGGGDANEAIGKAKKITENINRFLNNEPLQSLINLAQGY